MIPRTFDWLAARIRAAAPRLGPIRLVAVDGPGGAGKSTFARRLAAALGGASVIETDDFASAHDALGWWDRFEREALAPLARGEAPRYRRWDWAAQRLGSWREHRLTETVIVEGVSSSRMAVADRLSFAVWVEAPADERLSRGLARDGEDARPFWERWMAEEEAHFARDGARERADLVVDASGEPSDGTFLERPRVRTTDDRLGLALGASVSWYEDVFATHGIGYRSGEGIWSASGPAPAFHSAVITLNREVTTEDVAARIVDPAWGGLKDSFATIDGPTLGMGLLFEATWIHRAPATPASVPGWTVVEDADGLASWNRHGETTGVLLPELLARPGFTFLERRSGGHATAGAVLRMGSGVIGLSNVHAVGGTPVDWEELAAVAAAHAPDLPIVGFETGADLEGALAAGWEALGPVRIWAPVG